MVGKIAKIICSDLESGDKVSIGKIYQDIASISDDAEQVASDVRDFYAQNEDFMADYLSYANEDILKDGKKHIYEFYIETKIFLNVSHRRIENPYLLYFTTSDVKFSAIDNQISFKNLSNIKIKKLKEVWDKIKTLDKTIIEESEKLADEREAIISEMAENILYAVELDEETITKICSRLYSLRYRKV